MAIYLPQRWEVQPTFPVGIDQNSPFSRGLVHAASGFNFGRFQSVNNPVVTPISAGSAGNSLGVKFTAASSQYLIDDAIVKSPPLTFFVIGTRGSTAATNRALMSIGAGTADAHLLYITGNGELAMYSRQASGTAGQALSATGAIGSATTVYSMCGVVSSNASRKVYIDGTLRGTNTTSVAAASSSKQTVGGYYLSGAMVADIYAEGNIVFAGAWNRELSLDEIVELQRNPWQVFKRQPKALYFDLPAGGGVSVAPASGAQTIAGFAPSISQSISVAVASGAITLAGYTASVSQPNVVTPGSGTVAGSGYAPTIAQPLSVSPGAGAPTFGGYAPAISQAAGIYPAAGAVVFAGTAPTINQPLTVAPGLGAFDILGYAPTVAQAKLVYPGAGQIVFIGYAPSLTQPRTVATGAGAIRFDGYVHGIYQPSARPFTKINIGFGPESNKLGARANYIDGAPGLRLALYNQGSSLFFYPALGLMFDPGSGFFFDNPSSSYPGFKIEVAE